MVLLCCFSNPLPWKYLSQYLQSVYICHDINPCAFKANHYFKKHCHNNCILFIFVNKQDGDVEGPEDPNRDAEDQVNSCLYFS